jgi:hypothetical protein
MRKYQCTLPNRHSRTRYAHSRIHLTLTHISLPCRYVNGQLAGSLGEVLIRCNNVLYIRAAPEDVAMGGDGQGDDNMDM